MAHPRAWTVVLALAVLGCGGTTGMATEAAPASDGLAIRLESVATGLGAPLGLTEPDDGTGRRFVIDQVGRIYILDDGGLSSDPFLDISDRIIELTPEYDERGLLGLAFHPDYANNGRFFVYYSAQLRDEAPDNWDHTSHVSEFRVSDDPDRADDIQLG